MPQLWDLQRQAREPSGPRKTKPRFSCLPRSEEREPTAWLLAQDAPFTSLQDPNTRESIFLFSHFLSHLSLMMSLKLLGSDTESQPLELNESTELLCSE